MEDVTQSETLLLENLTPESDGCDQVKKQLNDVEDSWKKLERDIKEKIESVCAVLSIFTLNKEKYCKLCKRFDCSYIMYLAISAKS